MDKAEKIFAKLAEDYTREGLLAGGLTMGIPALAYGVLKHEELATNAAKSLLMNMMEKNPPKSMTYAKEMAAEAVKKGKKATRIAIPLTVLGMGFMGAGIGGTIGTYTKKKPIPRRSS